MLGFVLVCGAGPASSVTLGHVRALFCYFICTNPFRLELDGQGMSITGEILCVCVSTVAVRGRVLVYPQESERGSSRAFNNFTVFSVPPPAFYGNVVRRRAANQSINTR